METFLDEENIKKWNIEKPLFPSVVGFFDVAFEKEE